jgi:hypothetical protein
MIATVGAPIKNARVDAIFTDVYDALCRIIEKHHVTYDEYREAVNWLTVAGTQEHEIPLLFDVFMATAIDNENFAGRRHGMQLRGSVLRTGRPGSNPRPAEAGRGRRDPQVLRHG